MHQRCSAGCKYTSDIQTFERKAQQKFVSSQYKFLANSFFRRKLITCNIYKSLLEVTFFVHFYFLGSLNQRPPVSFIFQYQTLSLQLYLIRDEVCPLIKGMGVENVWTFKGRLQCISSTFTNITIPIMKSIS